MGISGIFGFARLCALVLGYSGVLDTYRAFYQVMFKNKTSHSKIDPRKSTRTMIGYQTIRYCALAKNGIDFLQAFTFQEMSPLKSSNRSSEANCLLILVTGLMELVSHHVISMIIIKR